uniref:Odorant receptor 47 n=1 Tax=Eucryptorrhynchus brandti TaxID=436910 RepID=A0A8F2JG44_EUCBR|nr:odorant receptor 47 [Eucryptorrhynchus brandti]
MLIIVFVMAIKMALCRTKRMSTVLRGAIENAYKTSVDPDKCVQNIFSADYNYALVINILLAVWTFAVGLFLTVGAVFENSQFRKNNDILDENIEMPMQVVCWYPFNVRKHYVLVLSYQFFVILFSDVYNSALNSLSNTVMIQIAMDIKVLQHRFRYFAKGAAEDKARVNLMDCIKNHQKLIEHIKELNHVLKYPLLIEYAVSSIMLASILVQTINGNRPIFNGFYFGILAFQWFILSWNSNEIIVQSEYLSMAIYESDWYNCDKYIKQLLMIVVQRTKRPLILNIGPFGAMNIDASISRLKLAYSYVSLMSS